MKPMLKRTDNALHHYSKGKRIDGPNPSMSGECSGLRGNCTGLLGNLDDCELTDDERKAGVSIQSLVAAKGVES